MNESQKPLIEQGWLRALLFLFSFFGVAILFLVPTEYLLDKFQVEQAQYRELFLELSVTCALFFLLYPFCYAINRRSVKSLGFAHSPTYLVHGLLLGVLIHVLGFGLLVAMGCLQLDGITLLPGIFIQALFYLLVAIFEEVLVRGYVLQNLMQSFDKYVALFISSILFASLHLLNPNISAISFTNIALAGVLLGINYIHSQNLWFAIALHFSWNFVQGPILGFEVSGLASDSLLHTTVNGHKLITGGAFGFEGSVIATALMVAASFWLDKYYEKSEANYL